MSSEMVVVGLGNPGAEYAATRHNIAWVALDHFVGDVTWKTDGDVMAAKCTAGGRAFLALKPQRYMNRSGDSMVKFLNFYKIKKENILILHDDCGLEFGQLKLSVGCGHGGHRGVENILKYFPEVARLRIGIGQKPHPEMALEDYVLGRFTIDESEKLASLLIGLSGALSAVLKYGVTQAMNLINRKEHEIRKFKEI